MATLSLVPRTNSDTIRFLECMLDLARSGDLVGLVMFYRMLDGDEDVGFTGRYEANPCEALRAAMCVSIQLTQFESEVRGHP